MIERNSGWTRPFAPLMLAVALVVAAVGTPAVQAQQAPEGEEKSEGDPVPGYLGVLLLSIGVMFAVGKSARR
jgi:hypothetical protein